MTDSYICLDMETTGLNPVTDRIIEIGAVKITEGKETDRFSTFLFPGRKLPERITEITGITDEMLSSAPPERDVIPHFLEWLEDYPLLGHNLQFDYSFLKQTAFRCGLTMAYGKQDADAAAQDKTGMDTLLIARKYLPQLERRSLEYLTSYYGIQYRAHRAMGDVLATTELYQRLVAAFYQPEEKLFTPQSLHFAPAKESPATKPQKQWLYGLLAKHKIIPDYDVESLTKSEASRTIDRILSQYGR